MMDWGTQWPLALAAALTSGALLGWRHLRNRPVVPPSKLSPSARRGSPGGQAKAKVAATPPAHGKRAAAEAHLDTLQAWEPMSTRVLNTSEREAYHVLRKALPDHMILGQVPVARFVKVPTEHSYSEWLRRVGSLCADLVVCDMASQVVAVVEVRQTTSREKERTQKRHARMDRVLTAARIPVHVWLEGALPGPAVARETILGAAIHTAGRAGYADLGVARRDAEAAAVVASMQSPVGHMHGLMVDESPLDFHVQAWSDDEHTDAEHREPQPSTWFDDLDGLDTPADAPASRPAHAGVR